MKKKRFRNKRHEFHCSWRVCQYGFPLCRPWKVWGPLASQYPSLVNLNIQVLFLHLQNSRLYLEVFSLLLNKESFLQISSELKGQYMWNPLELNYLLGSLKFPGASGTILGLQWAQSLPFQCAVTLWLLHPHFSVTKYPCVQRTRQNQWLFSQPVYWKRHTHCSSMWDEEIPKSKQVREQRATLERQKDENYQEYIWWIIKYHSYHLSAL